MTVEDFFTKLNEQLNTYKHQYERQDEGRVYIGLPNFDFSNFTKHEKTYFVYYLSFFVAFDLLVYTYDNQNYLKQKGILKIPKFEYGLTNVFIHPEAIFNKFSESLNPKISRQTVNMGIEFLTSQFPENQIFNVLINVLSDCDFSTGRFNIEFKKNLEQFYKL